MSISYAMLRPPRYGHQRIALNAHAQAALSSLCDSQGLRPEDATHTSSPEPPGSPAIQASDSPSLAKVPAAPTKLKKSHARRRPPGRDPRPMNAFLHFRTEHSSTTEEKVHQRDLSRELGKRWNAMREDEKAPYFEMAEQSLIEHRAKYPSYASGPRARRNRAKKESAMKRNLQRAERIKKSGEALGLGEGEGVDWHIVTFQASDSAPDKSLDPSLAHEVKSASDQPNVSADLAMPQQMYQQWLDVYPTVGNHHPPTPFQSPTSSAQSLSPLYTPLGSPDLNIDAALPALPPLDDGYFAQQLERLMLAEQTGAMFNGGCLPFSTGQFGVESLSGRNCEDRGSALGGGIQTAQVHSPTLLAPSLGSLHQPLPEVGLPDYGHGDFYLGSGQWHLSENVGGYGMLQAGLHSPFVASNYGAYYFDPTVEGYSPEVARGLIWQR